MDSLFFSKPQVISVSDLNEAVAQTLQNSFSLRWVSGEISNFTRAVSGHWYFTLKDSGAQVRAVMFKTRSRYAGFIPQEGDHVEVSATVTLYQAKGDYQLSVDSIRRAGIGNLYQAFLQLKEKLLQEGLLDASRKQLLPSFPKVIGLLTSLDGAALHDIISTLKRRAAQVRVIIYPIAVQGQQAVPSILAMLNAALTRAEVDVLILARGGGSIEDLAAFNDEAVARAIAASMIPTISAIGHETDFTIADFVADVRAATPTAAAQLVCKDRAESLQQLQHYQKQLRYRMQVLHQNTVQNFDQLSLHALHILSPLQSIQNKMQQLKRYQEQLQQYFLNARTQARQNIHTYQHQLLRKLPNTALLTLKLSHHRQLLLRLQKNQFANEAKRLEELKQRLEALNPKNVLHRGYAIVTNAAQKVVRNLELVEVSDILDIELANGHVAVSVTHKKLT